MHFRDADPFEDLWETVHTSTGGKCHAEGIEEKTHFHRYRQIEKFEDSGIPAADRTRRFFALLLLERREIRSYTTNFVCVHLRFIVKR